ncbi:MAG: hypothetical protein V1872_07580 [bacterium]
MHKVNYLVVGGYAVGYHGYPRATADMDIWIAIDEHNAEKIARVVHEFGMPEGQVNKELFLEKNKIIRMGLPPVRIEVITGASGVDFQECFSRKETIEIEDIPVNFISLNDLKENKKASGRFKDLEDLKQLS